MNEFWVITASEDAFGPYSDYESAYIFATINLGMEGWTITQTKYESENFE